MKLRLPHKLQAALLAAVASVSFTTVSSATLGAAAAWAFFSGHAGAEDLTHDPILTQQLDHAKQIEFGKLSLSETGAEQVENNVAKSSFGCGDVTSVDAAATLGGDIVDAVLCEGYSEAGGSWPADAAALSAALDPAATSEFVTAEGLATIGSGESVSVVDAAAPATAASSLDLAPQQDNSYNATTATGSSSSSNNTSVSAPAVGAGAGAGSFGGASGYVASSRSMSPVFKAAASTYALSEAVENSNTLTSESSASQTDSDSVAFERMGKVILSSQPATSDAANSGIQPTGDISVFSGTTSQPSIQLVSGTESGNMKNATWTFEDNMAATTTITGLNYVWVSSNSNDPVYSNTNMTMGTKVGDYYLTADLGQAITFADGEYIKVSATPYWTSGEGNLNTGNNKHNSYTVIAWVKLDSVSGEQEFFGTGDSKQNGMGFGLNGGQADILTKWKAHNNFSALTVSAGEWVNVAFTYDKETSTGSAYINGNLVAEKTIGDSNDPGGTCSYIGASAADADRDNFAGQIAELSILAGAYTRDEILVAAHLTSVKPDPIRWAGTQENHTWVSSGVWADGRTFSSELDVAFGSDGYKTVTINSSITAGIVTVGDNYTFAGSGSLTATSVTVSDGSTLVNDGITLNATIDGSGVYKTEVKNQTHVLGNNVSLANTWTGEVWLSGTATSLNLSDAKKAGSTLVLNGLEGYLASWQNGECNQDLKLVDNGNTKAITFTNGGSDYAQTFSGAFSGDGTFYYYSNSNPQKYGDLIFTGNLTGFGGTFNAGVHAFVDGTQNMGAKNGEGIMQFGATDPAAYSSSATATDGVIRNIAGTASSSIYSSSVVRFNYAKDAARNKLGVDNSRIHARYIEFNRDGGTAEYLVTAALEGHDSTVTNNTIKVSGGKATFSGAISGFGNVIANGGDVDIFNLADATQIKNLTLASGSTAGFYTGSAVNEAAEATLALTTLTVQGSDATLNANVSLGSGSILSLAGTLAMGSDVTLASGVNLTLSEALTTQLAAGGSVTLFSGVDTFNSSDAAVSVSAGNYFGDDWADYTLRYSDGNLILGTALDNYWKGGNGSWSDVDGWYDNAGLSGSAHAFESGNVYFVTDSSVSVTESVAAGNMEVKSGTTTTVSISRGKILMVDTLTGGVGQGGGYATGGNLNLSGGSVVVKGQTKLNELAFSAADSTATFNGETSLLSVSAAETGAVLAGTGAITVTNTEQDCGVRVEKGKSLTIQADSLSTETLYNLGAVNIGDGTTPTLVKATYFVNGNMQDGSVRTLFTVASGSTLAISGGDNEGNTHKTGLVLSEWQNETTGTVSGNLLARNATLLGGRDNAFTLNIEAGGVVAVKGIKSRGSMGNTVNLKDGGTLVFGGTTSNGTGGTLNASAGSTIGISAAEASYNRNIEIAAEAGKVLTIDTAKYEFNGDGTAINKTATGGQLTLSGTISGTGAMTKTGDGTLKLSASNSFTGDLVVSGGTLELGNAQALGAVNGGTGSKTDRTIRIDSGAAIDLKGTDDRTYVYTLNGGTLQNTGSGTNTGHAQTAGLVLTADSSVGGTGAFYILNNSYNAATVNMNGNGAASGYTLTKTGRNTIGFYSTSFTNGGTIKVDEGTLNFTKNGHGDGTVSSDIVINREGVGVSGQFILADGTSVSSTHAGAGVSAVMLLQGATTVAAGAGQDLTLSGVLSDASRQSGSITKDGDGTVTLSGVNTYSGGTTVSAGTLVAGNAKALGTGAVTLTGGTLDLSANSAYATGAITMSSGTLKLAGAEMLTSTGDISLTGGTLDLSRLTLTEGTDSYTLATGSSVSLAEGMTKAFTLGSGASADDYELAVVGGNTLVLNYATAPTDLYWVGGDGGSGTWDTEATNKVWAKDAGGTAKYAFVDGLNVHFEDVGVSHMGVEAAAVTLDEDVSVEEMTLATSQDNIVQLDFTHVRLEGTGSLAAKNISIGTGSILNTAVGVTAASVDIDDDAVWIYETAGSAIFAGTLTGEGNFSKAGEGSLSLTGDSSSFTGSVGVSDGVLVAGSSSALGAADVDVYYGGTLELGAACVTANSLALGSGSTLQFDSGSSMVLTGTLDISEGGAAFTFSDDYFSDYGSGTLTLLTFGSKTGDTSAISGLTSDLGEFKWTDTSLTFTFTLADDSVIWKDAYGTWSEAGKWYDEQGGRTSFANGDDITFAPSSLSSRVTMDGDKMVGDMVVENGSVTITSSAVENGPVPTLTANSLVMEDMTYLKTDVKVNVKNTITMAKNSYWELQADDDSAIRAAICSKPGEEELDGTAMIHKSGQGTVTLDGDNSGFSGTIEVHEGTLAADSGTALGTDSSVDVDKGATLTLQAAVTGPAKVELQSGATLAFETLAFEGAGAFLTAGALTLNSGSYIDLTKYDLSSLAAGGRVQIADLGNLYGTVDRVTLLSDNRLAYLTTNSGTPALGRDSSTGIYVAVNSAQDRNILYWQGGLGNWGIGENVEKNWYIGNAEECDFTNGPVGFLPGDSVVFDRSRGTSSVSLIEQDIVAGSVTVNSDAKVTMNNAEHAQGATLTAMDGMVVNGDLTTYMQVDVKNLDGAKQDVAIGKDGKWTIVAQDAATERELAGNLTGSGTLAKDGAGSLTLTGNNSGFSGTLDIKNGTVLAENANVLGTGSTIKMGDGTELGGTSVVNVNGNTFSTQAGASATVTANLDIREGSILTFDSNGALAITGGSITGSGSVVVNGFGLVSLGGTLAYTGDTTVNSGTLALTTTFTSGNDFTVTQGSTLQFAGAGSQKLRVNTLALQDGAMVDLRNLNASDFTTIVLDQDGKNRNVQAAALGTYSSIGSGTTVSTKFHTLDSVAVLNVTSTLDSEESYARLFVKNNTLYVGIFEAFDGSYHWHGSATDGSGTWYFNKPENSLTDYVWTVNGNEKKSFEYNPASTSSKKNGAYFSTLRDTQGNLITEADVTVQPAYDYRYDRVGDLIIEGDTKYVFTAGEIDPSVWTQNVQLTYIQQNGEVLSTFLVRSGAEAVFNIGYKQSDGALLRVDEDARLEFHAYTSEEAIKSGYNPAIGQGGSASGSLQVNNTENHGELLAHAWAVEFRDLINFGHMEIDTIWDQSSSIESGDIQLDAVLNEKGASLKVAGSVVSGLTGGYFGDPSAILNHGDLTFATAVDNASDTLYVGIPTEGDGHVYTEGKNVVFNLADPYTGLMATIEAAKLTAGAESTEFDRRLTISDKTNVEAGSKAYVFADAALADTSLDGVASVLHVGAKGTYMPNDDYSGYVLYSAAQATQVVDAMTAVKGSELHVDRGATLTMDSFNTGKSADSVGSIYVGEIGKNDSGETKLTTGLDATLVSEGDAVVDTFTVYAGTATVQGNASINQIMQDGGTLTLEKNSVLNGSPVSEGSETLTGGTVTGGTLVLNSGMTLDQNAVVDVRKAEGAASATYTINGQGSKIDATDLTLTVDKNNLLFDEIVDSGTVIGTGDKYQSAVRSGFMAAGDEYVKLFDMGVSTTLYTNTTGEAPDHYNQTVTHGDASGSMILIDTTIAGMDDDAIKELFGVTDDSLAYWDPRAHVGYAYLHTEKVAYQTYYVRDLYTDAVTDSSGTVLRDADRVTLGSIIDTAAAQDTRLQKVVFDTTTYNTKKDIEQPNVYNGTLTVDRDTAVDLFVVAEDTKAAINIVSGITVTANEHSAGVQGTLHLEGEGVYEITNRADLGTGISLRGESGDNPEWDGTVRIKGSSQDLNIDAMSVGSGADASTIEFNHWEGTLAGGEHTSDAFITLVGPDAQTNTPAINLQGGEEAAYVWNNTVTGDGAVILHESGKDFSLTLNGDTSAWTGKYEQQAGSSDELVFTGENVEGGAAVTSGVAVSNGTLEVTYGSNVTHVGPDAEGRGTGASVYTGGNLTLNYQGTMPVAGGSGTTVEVTSSISSDSLSTLALVVGDGEQRTVAEFKGAFDGTGKATMHVKDGSQSVISTDAELLKVTGDAGSGVTISDGDRLELTGKVPETDTSVFHNLTNEGIIDMQANGGDIRLVVDDGVTNPTYKVGALELTGEKGTAAIQTAANDQVVEVEITNLKSEQAGEVLVLENTDNSGTVNYNLGGKTEFEGTIQFGSAGTGVANVVLKSNDVAAKSVLESVGNGTAADVVVDTANAGVLGITSADDASVAGKVYGTPAEGSEDNRQVTITGSDTYSYNGGLGEHLDIAYTGNGKQTFEGGATGFKGDVTVDNGTAEAGVLEVLNVMADASMSIEDLTIGANNTLAAKAVGGGNADVTVSGTLLAKGGSTTDGTGNASRMDANLTLASGSTLDVSNAAGLGGLDLGGSMTITSGAYLSGGDIANLLAMDLNTKYDLAFDVVGVNFSSGAVDETAKLDASQYFANLGKGEYYICYTGVDATGGKGGNVGTVYLYRAAPEPTTGTLSLLALAALCARRRRKA